MIPGLDEAFTPENVVVEKPELPKVEVPREYTSVAADSRDVNISQILTEISGDSYFGDWFSQLLGKSDAPKDFQLNQNEVYQQYNRINNFETKLQGSLQFSKNKQDGTTTVTGTLRLYPSIVPNVGDVFVADTGDNRLTAFSVTSVTELSRFKKTVYEVEITSKFYYDEIKEELDDRVVETYYFSRSHLNQNGLIHSSDVEWVTELKRLRGVLTEQFNYHFLDYSTNTYLVEKDFKRVYDEFVVRAFSDATAKQTTNVTVYETQEPRLPIRTVYDLNDIVNGNLAGMQQEMRLVETKDCGAYNLYNSIRWADIQDYVWPVTEPTMAQMDAGLDHRSLRKYLSPPLNRAPETKEDINPEVKPSYISGSTIKSPSEDFYYVLSAAWYQCEPSLYSRLESILGGLSKDKAFCLFDLYEEAKSLAEEKEDLERVFYHTPLVLMLINIVIRR